MKFHMDDSGTWSLGVLIGGPLLTLLVIAFVIGGFAWLHAARKDNEGFFLFLAIMCWVLGGLTVIGMGVGYYPYGGDYHQYRNVSGTVAKIDSRLIGNSGGGTDTKFVVRFDGSATQFACDDTRCAQVDEGDALTLSCKRTWQYTGTDGYDCRFVKTEAA